MRWLAAGLALWLVGCAEPVHLPKLPMGAGPAIVVETAPVALNAQDPSQTTQGGFVFAGGLSLSSDQTSRLHGLSDLEVTPDGRLTAVSDEGDLLQARLVLSPAGRLTGLTAARLTTLTDLTGLPLQSKAASDSEGLAILANGDRLISFERQDRIWLYPARGGKPRVVPAPQASFPENAGLEALGPAPSIGPDAYLAGAEDSGEVWICRVSTSCTPTTPATKPPEFGLVAIRSLADGSTAYLLRAFDPVRGNRVTLEIRKGGETIARLDLARPLTVDNFEGVSAVRLPDGRTRFFLISDDNFNTRSQKTLLLAFDWKPGA
jgi:hypothetical protein